ncbi:MAG: hypothetical protein ACI4KG_05075 [Oscillospiraceae bacterium]
MTFAADKNSAVFGGVKIFVEEYSFSRSAAAGETQLANGGVSVFNGGGKAVRVKLCGTSEGPCADILDGLLCNCTALDLIYGGMQFGGAVLTSYKCEGKSGGSERVTAEFVCEAAVSSVSGGTEV